MADGRPERFAGKFIAELPKRAFGAIGSWPAAASSHYAKPGHWSRWV
jgi:hypothetical protein